MCDSVIDSDALCGSALHLQVESDFDTEVSTVELDLGEMFPDADLDTLRTELFGPAGASASGSTPGGARRSLLQRVTESPITPQPDQVLSTVPSDHDYVGCSLFSFPERTRNNSSRSVQPQQIVVNSNRVDNVQFVIGNSETSALHPSIATPTTNGPTSTDS